MSSILSHSTSEKTLNPKSLNFVKPRFCWERFGFHSTFSMPSYFYQLCSQHLINLSARGGLPKQAELQETLSSQQNGFFFFNFFFPSWKPLFPWLALVNDNERVRRFKRVYLSHEHSPQQLLALVGTRFFWFSLQALNHPPEWRLGANAKLGSIKELQHLQWCQRWCSN